MGELHDNLIWMSVPKYTVIVRAVAGKIVEAAPVVRRLWMGKSVEAFIQWHERTFGDKCVWRNL